MYLTSEAAKEKEQKNIFQEVLPLNNFSFPNRLAS